MADAIEELAPRRFPLGFGSPYAGTVYAEHGGAICAPGPQAGTPGRGWDEIPPGWPGYLIAESIPCPHTRRLLAHAPALFHWLEVVLDADRDVRSEGLPPILSDLMRAIGEKYRSDILGPAK